MQKSKAFHQPFHFCTNLSVLLACTFCQSSCSSCNADISYFVKPDSVVRKRRKAKPIEQSVPSSTVTFRVNQSCRTAKHKRHYNVDSGATCTVVSDISCLHSITEINPNKRVQVANKQFVDVVCTGTALLTLTDDNGRPYELLLDNVMYSPKFSCNLLSVEQLYQQHKIATVFKGPNAHFVTPHGISIPFSTDHKRRYILQANMALSPDNIALLWHRRLCHAGSAAIRRMACAIPQLQKCTDFDFTKCDACLQGAGRRIPLSISPKRSMPDSAFRKSKSTARFTYFGERISADLCGPMPVGFNGELYLMLLHDSATGAIFSYAIKDKTQECVLDAFRLFLSDHSDKLTRGIGHFHSDNGGEFQNESMETFCEELCIRRTYTVPYLPSQNPYAERANGTILRPLRTVLVESKCSEQFWPSLCEHICTVHNSLVDEKCISPYERIYGQRFDYTKLHVPGCLCYYLVPERDRPSKLSPRAVHAQYLGLDPQRNGHRVWVPSMQRLTTAFHVVFNEHRSYDPKLDKARVTFNDATDDRFTDGEPERIGDRIRRQRAVSGYRETRDEQTRTPSDTAPEPFDRWQDLSDPKPANDSRHGTPEYWSDDHCENSKCLYPKGHTGLCSDQEVGDAPRRRKPPNPFAYATCDNGCIFHADHCGECMDEDRGSIPSSCTSLAQAVHDSDSVLDFDPMETLSVIIDDVQHEVLRVDLADQYDLPCPKQYEDTQRSPLKLRWDESMREEHEALLRNGTWVYVSRNDPRLRGRQPTKSRWVYTIKYNRDGTISRFKSRFVVCGYSQRQGIDYDRAFSSTLRATSFRTLLAIAAGKKLRLMQIDVSNAFTQAYMDDVDMFVEPAKGFEEWETINGKRVSKLLYLKRALYGTKQASRLWQNTLREHLETDGFVSSKADPCLYHKRTNDGEIIVGVYVDDCICAYRGDELFKHFQTRFFKRFPGKCGKLDWFLGMAIDQHEDYSVHVNHELSITKMADRYIPNNKVTRECPPSELFNKLDRATSDVERAKVQSFQYASVVGAILYIAVMSRPDIAWHASILAKFLADPSSDCCDAATQLLQYLHSTRKKRLYFSGKIEVPEGLEKHEADVRRNFGFVAYSDSSWGNKYPYPMFGYSVYLYGSLISFSSKQLKTVAFSSCEAEYAAGSYACKEIEFIRHICADMGVALNGRLVLAVDNTACMDIAYDVGVSGRTKHYDRAIHYMRDLTQYRRLLPAFVRTHLQRADGFTKALDKSKFVTWIKHLLHD